MIHKIFHWFTANWKYSLLDPMVSRVDVNRVQKQALRQCTKCKEIQVCWLTIQE